MIRQTVGAVVFQHSEFLLVHKVKISDIDGEYAMSKGNGIFLKVE